jgi:hypothetical protein
MNLTTWDETKWLPHNSYYRGLTATLSTKTGPSIVAVTGLSSLRDELPEFRRTDVGNDRQAFREPEALAEI